MKHATLRQMEVFETVARLSSYSRAAAELHLTQPAVSTQIRKLEEHAGVPLFEQFGKKIYLTQAGEELLHHSRVILQQFSQISELRRIAAMQPFRDLSADLLRTLKRTGFGDREIAAIYGVPEAIASSKVIEAASLTDVSTNTSTA